MRTKYTLFSLLVLLLLPILSIPVNAAIDGSVDYTEVVVGGRVSVTWTGLTDGTAYSVEVAGETAANFTAAGTRHKHSVIIESEGSNAIILYNSSYVAQKTLYVTGSDASGFFPETLFFAIFAIVMMVVILVAIVVGVLAWLKGGIKF